MSLFNKEKVFYCSYKMILNTNSKAGESISNDWQKEKLDTSHEILHRKNNFGELTRWKKCNYLFFNNLYLVSELLLRYEEF